MTDKDTVALPQNVEEFNAIAGFVFAQLYKEFPVHVSMNKDSIAHQMGVASPDDAALPSGRPFKANRSLYAKLVGGRGLYQEFERRVRHQQVVERFDAVRKRSQSAQRCTSQYRQICRFSPQKSL
jgi:hypothetical protein